MPNDTAPTRRGRPRLDRTDRSVAVYVRLPSAHYDAAYDEARRARISVPELVRRRVARMLQGDDDDRSG